MQEVYTENGGLSITLWAACVLYCFFYVTLRERTTGRTIMKKTTVKIVSLLLAIVLLMGLAGLTPPAKGATA